MRFDNPNLSILSTIHLCFFENLTHLNLAEYKSFPHYPQPIIIKESLINSIFIFKGQEVTVLPHSFVRYKKKSETRDSEVR